MIASDWEHLKHSDYYLTGHRTWKKVNEPPQAPLFFSSNFNLKQNIILPEAPPEELQPVMIFNIIIFASMQHCGRAYLVVISRNHSCGLLCTSVFSGSHVVITTFRRAHRIHILKLFYSLICFPKSLFPEIAMLNLISNCKQKKTKKKTILWQTNKKTNWTLTKE